MRRLWALVVPALAQVNLQIRHSFLPVFIKQIKLNICTGPYKPYTTFKRLPFDHAAYMDRNGLDRVIQAAEDPLDPIHLFPLVVALTDSSVVFTHIVFLIHDTQSPEEMEWAWENIQFYNSRSSRVGRPRPAFQLKWSDRQLGFGKPKADALQDHSERWGRIILRLMELAEAIVAAREEFNGFTLEDLRQIASKLTARVGEVKVDEPKVPGSQ